MKTEYASTLEFLYSQIPAFHRIGSQAYKPGLERVLTLSAFFDNPHSKIRTIHVAGTNGKGSTAHSLAAVLSAAGYKTGLFTSPHILDFRERIRIDGKMIPEEEVISFVKRFRMMEDSVSPSFFELTTVMAFDYFCRMGVDIAVIEVGLGGRLDSSNIITPEVSVITNISLDHTSLLGDTVEEIASEKAGIIKSHVPVVIGEADGGVKDCFLHKARLKSAPIVFADTENEIIKAEQKGDGIHYSTHSFGEFIGSLTGDFQIKNTATVLETVKILNQAGHFRVGNKAIEMGLGHVTEMTGLMGRWMKIADSPLTICDTGHNPGGWKYISRLLSDFNGIKRIVIGFVNDKDVDSILSLLTRIPAAEFYFTSPSTPRALSAGDLQSIAAGNGLPGRKFTSVAEAYKNALADVIDKSDEMIFIGGSNFVVADFLDYTLNGRR